WIGADPRPPPAGLRVQPALPRSLRAVRVGAAAGLRRRRRAHGEVLSARSRASLMPLVEVVHLVKQFRRGGGMLRASTTVKAVDDVSFSIDEGETFGLVGDSGSCKTT